MSEGGSGASNGSSGGAAAPASAPGSSRPRVQQLRPTNKDASNVPRVVLDGGRQAVARGPGQGGSNGAAAAAGAPASAAGGPPGQRPQVVPRIVTGQGSGSSILVNSCQRGNPVLQGIKNVGWEYADIVPDYQVGVSSCALFLSLRYHRLHPEYVHTRIQKLANMFTLRLLLVLCDVDQHQAALKELTKVALVNNLTLIVAWSSTEAGRYLETYKALEHRPPDLIRQRVANDYLSHLSSALTSVRGVNKTDVVTLASNFGSLKRIARADAEELAMCNGFGPTKVRRLTDAFHQPFRIGETRSWKERRGTLARSKGFFGNPDEVASTTTTRNRDRAGVAAEVGAWGPGEETAAVAGASAESADTRGDEEDARDDFDVLENMTEEEQLQLALEMSRSNGLDEDDLGDD